MCPDLLTPKGLGKCLLYFKTKQAPEKKSIEVRIIHHIEMELGSLHITFNMSTSNYYACTLYHVIYILNMEVSICIFHGF